MGLFSKGVKKTNESFFARLSRAVVGKSKVSEEVLDAIEEALISSDMGVDTTLKLIDNLEDRVERDKYMSMDELVEILRDEIGKLLNVNDSEAPVAPFDFSKKPFVMLVVGVNGVGKTTTIGKLAANLKNRHKKVIIAAADTFRAAAIEQLAEWANRAGVDLIAQQEGSDPAAVVYDACQAARSRNADVLICDTAGRLHNKKNLMNELGKIRRVIEREFPESHLETLIVLDGTTGQNALIQAREFKEVSDISGIVLTKLDGTAKGGIAIAIASELGIPVKYIGIGEKIDDLQRFDPDAYVNALFEKTEEEESEE